MIIGRLDFGLLDFRWLNIKIQSNIHHSKKLFGLTLQMKKSAVSIPANIAEGCGRGTDPQLVHFLDISLGSACELETHVIIAQRLRFLEEEQATKWVDSLHLEQKRIRSFRDKVQAGLL